MNKSLKIGLWIIGSVIVIGGGYLIYDRYIKTPTGKGEVSEETKKNTIKIVK